MYLVFKRTIKDQRRTKDEARNDQRTPKLKKSTFIKIAVSFTSLIPSLKTPTDDREMTERTPTEGPTTKKYQFLRLASLFYSILFPEYFFRIFAHADLCNLKVQL